MENKKILNQEQKNFLCEIIAEFQNAMNYDRNSIGGIECPMRNELCSCEQSGFKKAIDFYLVKLERFNHNIQFDEDFNFQNE